MQMLKLWDEQLKLKVHIVQGKGARVNDVRCRASAGASQALGIVG